MSSKQDKIIEFSTQQLKDVGVIDADGAGFLSYLHDGKPMPVTISKKRLCLPTKRMLEDNEWKTRIAFNPMSEQTNQGPSPILNAFKQYIYVRLTVTIKRLATSLLELAADTSRQKKLSEKASLFIAPLVGVDEKTKKALKAMLDRVSDTPENRLVSMFLKNGGKNGALRTCDVSFPFLDDAYSEDASKFFGVDMPRKTKDKAWLVALFDYILGDKDVRELYSSPSSDGEAPYYHSLLLAFNALATRFQGLIELHSPACPELKEVEFELAWSETLKNFGEFASTNSVAIPPLPGNRGQEKDAVIANYDLKDEDVGIKEDLDLPWDETDSEREKRLGRGRDRERSGGLNLSRDRDDRGRDDRRSGSDRDDGIKRISSKDFLGGKRRDDDRDDRGRSSRDRDDRGRDRDRGRSGFGSRDRGRDRGGRY